MKSNQEMLRLPVRYYQMWPPANPGGLVHEIVDLPVAETCFIALHCWNSGYPDGPPLPVDRYYVNTGVPQGTENSMDALRRHIIDTRIAPAMLLARKAGMTVVHVESRRVGSRYPQAQYMLGADEGAMPVLPEALPGWREEQAFQVGGGGGQWEGRLDMDIATPVRPLPEDYVAISGAQFDRILRHLGVVNLIYTGFHIGTCVTNSPAATREMSLRYGYRTLLLRECTLNLECPDFPDLQMTQAAIRYTEQHVGYTARLDDFLAQCRVVVRAREPRESPAFPHEVCHVDPSWPQ